MLSFKALFFSVHKSCGASRLKLIDENALQILFSFNNLIQCELSAGVNVTPDMIQKEQLQIQDF
jgi:hypothetical protein